MTAPFIRHTFADGAVLAEGLADFVARRLSASIATTGAATLAVSGGRTPTRFFRALSAQPIAWEQVVITLVDERWVGVESDRSNGRLVLENLMQGPAAEARFLPLYTGAATPEAGLPALEAAVSSLALPLTVAVLGMGDDGHTASFFPGGEGLAHALDLTSGAILAAVRAEAAGEARITLTLPPILAARTIVLHLEGAGKAAVLERALGPGEEADMPIRAVLRRAGKPIDLFWCP